MPEQINCQVARDLMPLALDQVCSEDSRRAVEDHIAQCAACAEAFADMKAATAKKIPDQTVDAGFRQAMKKGARRFRLWKALAAALAVILLFVAISVAANPGMLYGIRSTVPAGWMQNAHLERTGQGAVLLRFTPDARYRRFFGGGSWSGRLYDEKNVYEYRVSYSYPLVARLLNRDFKDKAFQSEYELLNRAFKDNAFQSEYEYADRYVLRLSNGDWAIALPFGSNAEWFYRDGRMGFLRAMSLTNEDIQELVKKGVPVDGSTEVIKFEDPWPDNSVLKLEGSEEVLYRAGDDIPLCDRETQEKFDRLLEADPYFFKEPGELIYNVNAMG